jgi:hypothetical protein
MVEAYATGTSQTMEAVAICGPFNKLEPSDRESIKVIVDL